MERLKINTGFGFSMTGIKNLNESSYTLALILLDFTGSVLGEETEIKRMLEQLLADGRRPGWGKRVLLSAMGFNSRIGVTELFGFDIPTAIDLSQIVLPDCYGATNLLEATATGAAVLEKAATELTNKDFITNLLEIIVTDGEENVDNVTPLSVRSTFNRLRKSEIWDSFKVILTGLKTGQPAMEIKNRNKTVDDVLSELTASIGVDQYESAKEVKSGTYGKIGGFISQSISSANQALGSGSPSQNIDFTV